MSITTSEGQTFPTLRVAGLTFPTLFTIVTSRRTLLVLAKLNELATDAGVLESAENIGGETRGKLNNRVIRKNFDGSEVFTTESALVRKSAHNLARLYLVTLSHFDAVRTHGLTVSARPALGAVGAVGAVCAVCALVTVETFARCTIVTGIAIITGRATATVCAITTVTATISAAAVSTVTSIASVSTILAGLPVTLVTLRTFIFCRKQKRSVALGNNC